VRINKQKIKQILYGLSLVLPAVLLVAGFFLYSPSTRELKILKKELWECEKDIKFMEENELPQKKSEKEALAKFQARFEEVKNKIALVEERLPSKEHLGSFLEQLTFASKEADVDFFRIKSGEVKDYQEYLELPIEIELKSNFFKLGDYLERLERLSRLVKIKSIKIESEKEPDLLKTKFFASTFILKG